MNTQTRVSYLFILTVLLVVTTAHTVHADSNRFGSRILGKKIAGTYLVREGETEGNLSFLRLITLTADGNWLSTESHQQSRDFGFSDQQGVWKKSGRREITANVIDFDIGPDGDPTGVTRIRFIMTFSKNFKKVNGQFFGSNFGLDQDPLDPEEDPESTFEGIFSGNRVTVNLRENR